MNSPTHKTFTLARAIADHPLPPRRRYSSAPAVEAARERSMRFFHRYEQPQVTR